MGLRGPKRQPKHCPVCGTTDITAFGPNAARADGLQSDCRQCHKTRMHDKLTIRLWFYGLSKEQFQQKWDEQHGLCGICGLPLGSVFAIDHDHRCCPRAKRKTCGRCVRGIVHPKCNNLLGQADDDVGLMQKAIEYINQWKNKTFPSIIRSNLS